MSVDAFRHEALLYAGQSDFVTGTVPFVRDGVRAGEPVLVVESAERLRMLREALGDDAKHVVFADMAEVGANPARIIPAWVDFVDRHPNASRLRGIGEPIWNGRSDDELVECQRHEALLNTAFDDGRPWWLLCPYDVTSLPADVIAEAARSHRFVSRSDGAALAADYQAGTSRFPLNVGFLQPERTLLATAFDKDGIQGLRIKLRTVLADSGLDPMQQSDLIASVNEIASNSIIYGGGGGTVTLWLDSGKVVCEVRDAGTVEAPLADRRKPSPDPESPRGFWLANQLCDLVQVRSDQSGTAVRLHVRLRDGATRRAGLPDSN